MGSKPDRQINPRQLYGRRKGPALSARRKALLETLLPGVELTLDPDAGPIDTGALFADDKDDLWIEIGFGMGEHLAAQAAAHPNIGFIGCEPYTNGVAGLLSLIDEGGMENIRIYGDNALNVLEALPAGSAGRIFLLHPDPWHKRRHAGRRFVSPANLDIVATALRDGGEFRLQTDDPGYLRWAKRHLAAHKNFEMVVEKDVGAPENLAGTRYETKAQTSGRSSHYLCFRRNSGTVSEAGPDQHAK